MKRRFKALTLILFAYGYCICQTNRQPVDLQTPAQDKETPSDSIKTIFVSRQDFIINKFTSSDSCVVERSAGAVTVNQSALYDLDYNTAALSRNEYMDMSGSVVKKGVIYKGISLGLDWTPVAILNSSATKKAFLGSLDIGPVVGMNYFNVPLKLRTGFAAKKWNDSLSINGLSLNEFKNGSLNSDNGYYGAFEMGNFNSVLPFMPIHASVNGYGRNMGTSKSIAGVGSFLYAGGLVSGDSVLLSYNDSLVNGRDASLSEAGDGKSRYIQNSRRVERSYTMSGSLKGKRRFFLAPDIAYSYSGYSMALPSSSTLTSDRSHRDNALTMALASDSLPHINYSGSLRIDWEKEEKLGGKNIDMVMNGDSLHNDSMLVKIHDYNGYRAKMAHAVSMYSRKGMGFKYIFEISRYSQTYPLQYTDENDSVIRDHSDNDWIVQNHQIDATVFACKKVKIITSGEYTSNLRFYLDSTRSVNNVTDHSYKTGVSVFFDPVADVSIEENSFAEAKKTDFEYPELQAENQNYPPYSRRFTSRLGLNWNCSSKLTLRCDWNEIYSDQGYWYDSEYSSDTTDTVSVNVKKYYAIVTKTWEHDITASAKYSFGNNLMLEAGSTLKNIYETDYKNKKYTPNDDMIKYIVIPYINVCSAMNEHLKVNFKLRRYIDTIADDYWDFSFLFSVSF
jgi:hypothetical protein